MKTKKVFIPILLVLFIVLLTVLPYLGKAVVNNFLLKEIVFDRSCETKVSTVKLKKGDFLLFGEYLGEPVLWEVVAEKDGKTLISSKYVLCFKAFDANGESKHSRSSDKAKYGSNEWQGSSLQVWLNSTSDTVDFKGSVPDKKSVNSGHNAYENEKGFLCDENFSTYQKSLMTDDGVFVLSKQEMSKYFSSAERKKTATPSAIKANDAQFILTQNRCVWYWTSSPAASNNVSASAVTTTGAFYKALAYDGNMGVAPSIYLKGNEIETLGENGTESNPYYISREAYE